MSTQIKDQSLKMIGRYLVQLVVFGGGIYAIHWLVATVFEQHDSWEKSYYSLPQIHLVAFLATTLMTLLIVFSKKITPQSIGFAFLVLLTLKMVANYFFIHPALEVATENDFIKVNFLALFLTYLVFDVYVCYQLLNEKK